MPTAYEARSSVGSLTIGIFLKMAERKKPAKGRPPAGKAKRRVRCLIGKMGNRDASHTKDGRIVLENRSTNRSRNGEGGRRTKK